MTGIHRLVGILCILFMLTAPLSAQESGSFLLDQGVKTFGTAQYDEALRQFRNIILDSALAEYHGDSYFWIAKAYMALGQYENASKNLEFFLGEYPDNKYHVESLYQRGRLIFLQGEYEKSIQILEDFVSAHPSSVFSANSYFWIGESLYSLGHFEEALAIFEIVVNDYPRSFKVEAAGYRISLIELKERERELLKLLKWSHEEYLRALEAFDRKERSYEQALASYQRSLREIEAGAKTDADLGVLNDKITALQAEIERYKERLADAASQNASQENSTSANADLLDLKARALDLKSYYILWLSAL
ncbi:MAG: tetratricopeptide repeat protein, partial [Spirochaetales bacterium]|nr:tetratricopeptide repeat protein [Spirochaetales bacterium]